MTEINSKVAVLIPCRNEAVTVSKVISDVKSVLPDAVIYVYDNDSKDDTLKEAIKAGARTASVTRVGKGNVVKQMFADIESDCYVLIDGDDTYDVKVLPSLVEEVLTYGNDLVNVKRIASSKESFPKGHKLGNKGFAVVLRWFFKSTIEDPLSGLKGFSRAFVKSLPVMSTGFEIESEIVTHALSLGLKVKEINGSYQRRPSESKSNLRTLRDGFLILSTIVNLLRQERPLAFFFFIGFVLALVSIILGYPVVVTYFQIHKVPRFPTAILATGIMIVAFLSFLAGIVLDTVTRGRKEIKLLAYLKEKAKGT